MALRTFLSSLYIKAHISSCPASTVFLRATYWIWKWLLPLPLAFFRLSMLLCRVACFLVRGARDFLLARLVARWFLFLGLAESSISMCSRRGIAPLLRRAAVLLAGVKFMVLRIDL